MIVPMKKVTLVVLDAEREEVLHELRNLGIVHLVKHQVASDRLGSLIERKGRLETASGILRNYAAATVDGSGNDPAAARASEPVIDGQRVADDVLALSDKRKTEQEALAAELKERSRIEGWGNFDPEAFGKLTEAGVELRLYELPIKAYRSMGEDATLIVLSSTKTMVRCIAVGAPFVPGASILADQTPFQMPDRSLADIDASVAERRRRLAEYETAFGVLAADREALAREITRTIADIEFEVARVGMIRDEEFPEGAGVCWFSGFVPAEDAQEVKKAAARFGWALIIDDPADDDFPPTKVKNNALVRIVQPVFDLLGTVPGYREYDISLSFLLFFSLFFAMIFGDAGYGALLFAGALGFGLKAKLKTGVIPDGLLLLGLLSSATVVWGALTGTWFALPFDTLPDVLKAVVLGPFRPDPSLAPKEAAKLVQQNVKHLCFIIGTVQLVLAHAKNIKKALPSLTALAQLGWLSMVLGLYFLVLNLVLDKNRFPVPEFALFMIGGGLGAYFIFAEQKGGNFFKNVLAGFANFLPTFLSAVSSFSDIISYIRLFAVGLAGFAIAESFNGMAAGMPAGIVRIVAGGLILFFGHGLNLAMSALSVVVHGVRLNMLEYSGHLGMEWSGSKYAPFALKDEARRYVSKE